LFIIIVVVVVAGGGGDDVKDSRVRFDSVIFLI
jgi:hypothetical protein